MQSGTPVKKIQENWLMGEIAMPPLVIPLILWLRFQLGKWGVPFIATPLRWMVLVSGKIPSSRNGNRNSMGVPKFWMVYGKIPEMVTGLGYPSSPYMTNCGSP